MRKIVCIVTCMLYCCVSFSQKEMCFENVSLQEALMKARQENKPLFVYCYTSYGLSMYMSDKVLKNKKVTDLLSSKFICVCVNCEVDGIKVVEDSLKITPVFLIVRPDGAIQHKMPAIKGVDNFIHQIELGLNQNTCWESKHQRYLDGAMSKKELVDYYLLLKHLGEKEARVAYEKLNILLTDEDRVQANFWNLTFESEYNSVEFKFLLANLFVFKQNVGDEEVENFVFSLCKRVVNHYYGLLMTNFLQDMEKAKLAFKELISYISCLDVKNKDHLLDQVMILNYYSEGDMSQVLNVLDTVLGTDADQTTMAMGIRLVERKGNKEDLQRIIAFEDDLLAKSPEKSRMAIQKVFDRIKGKM